MGSHVFNIYLVVVVELSNIVDRVSEVFRASRHTHVLTYSLGGFVVDSQDNSLLKRVALCAGRRCVWVMVAAWLCVQGTFVFNNACSIGSLPRGAWIAATRASTIARTSGAT